MVFYNTNEVRDLFVNMCGELSVKEAFQKFFENEIVEKYICINCMKTVLASKKWKTRNTPEELCLILTYDPIIHEQSSVKLDRSLILKCFAETGIRYWKYKLVTATSHTSQGDEKDTYFTYMSHTSQEEEGYEILEHSPFKLIYKRIEVIFSQVDDVFLRKRLYVTR